MMIDICCLLLVGDSLTMIRFRPLRKSGIQAVQMLGKQFCGPSIVRLVIRGDKADCRPALVKNDQALKDRMIWLKRLFESPRCGSWSKAVRRGEISSAGLGSMPIEP
jgi:hypothetical protein